MFKKFLLTSFLLFSSLITIYPSKKENTNFFDYCYSLEKIISRNILEKSKNLSNNYKSLAKDITLFGTNKTKGTFANKIIDQYKNSKKLFIMPKEINWSKLAEGYQVNFKSVANFKKLREALDWSISIKKSVIIIVVVDPENEICEKNALLEKIIGC